MRPESVYAALLAVTSFGCGDLFGSKDAHQPGTPLGTFHVVAQQSSNSCGPGALGAAPTWEFDVGLARGEKQIFWNNGVEQITGQMDADDMTFRFQTAVVMDMRTEEDAGLPPCSLRRDDVASGVLASAGDDVGSFSADLGYTFSPTGDSECSDLVESEMPLFTGLPCAMGYGLAATRTKAPE